MAFAANINHVQQLLFWNFSEKIAEYIDKSEGEIAVMAASEVTKQTPDDVSNSNQDKSTEAAGQTGQSFPQPGKTDSSDRNDFTEIADARRESSEHFSEDHSGTCLSVEKQ